MENTSILEREVQTRASRVRANRIAGRFLKGPIPLPEIAQAARLPGRALALYLAIHHQMALTGKRVVTLPKTLLADLGVDKDSKSRGLKLLQSVGLIEVDMVKGNAARVALTSHRNSMEPA